MHEQVITINPDGSMETLRQKKGQGVDLREFGAVEMERVSEITLDDKSQKYYIRFLSGPLAGRYLSHWLYSLVCGKEIMLMDGPTPVLFEDYEDAVGVEIEFLNTVRLKNLSFDSQLDILAPQ